MSAGNEGIKGRTRALGLSVSTIARNILLNAYDLLEDILNDTTAMAMAVTGNAEPAPIPPPRSRRALLDQQAGAVLGWQQAVLNVNAVCTACNAVVPRGTTAAIGISATPKHQPEFLCDTCLTKLSRSGKKSRKALKTRPQS